MQTLIDETLPDSKWEFDSEVTQVFEDMLKRSIPQYEVMRQACFEIACQHQQNGKAIIDLGCSRGEAIAPLIQKFGAYNRFVCIEVSDPMLESVKERFQNYITSDIVEVRKMDLRQEYPPYQACITLCILTLQFTPIEYRQQILRRIYNHTVDGGVLVIVEKVLGQTADIDSLMVDLYYHLKSKNGYSQEQIERKRLSLEGVLVPVTAKWNEELLRLAGFREVDCFWRWMNFAGWLAVK